MHDPEPPPQELSERLAGRGVRLIASGRGVAEVECRVCRIRWQIADRQVPVEDHDRTDWWWCPNGCNREE